MRSGWGGMLTEVEIFFQKYILTLTGQNRAPLSLLSFFIFWIDRVIPLFPIMECIFLMIGCFEIGMGEGAMIWNFREDIFIAAWFMEYHRTFSLAC